jgi:DNA-binding NarL/FixJ family response regulator
LFAISDPPFTNYNGGPLFWGRTNLTTPILFFTSHNTEESLTLTELVGGNGFLSKSNSPAKLVEVVKKWSNVRIEKKQPL